MKQFKGFLVFFAILWLGFSQVANANNGINSLKELTSQISDEPAELLASDEAFAFTSETNGQGQVILNWVVAPNYYLYQEKIQATLLEGTAKLGALQLPKAENKFDKVFNKNLQVYYGPFTGSLPVTDLSGTAKIQITFQGCAEVGVCYPPMKKTIDINVATFGQYTGAAMAATASTPANAGVQLSETDQITDTLMNSTVWVVIGTFFLFGLLLSLTPCVFPMIPILSSIIVGQGDQLTTRKAFMMSLVYVLAMSVTYTVAGVLAGLFGENLQAAFQNVWIIGTFSVIFVLLAFSMFGFYELQLPSSIQTKITNLSNKQSGGTMTGVAIMGFLSALIVGPCVAPPLAGALIYIGQTGDALLGGSALFAMSLGMGLPLLLLGTSAGKLLPRAGGWMDNVKAVFGVLMLGVAIWMAERILPAEVVLALWAVLLIGSAVYLGALEPIGQKSGWFKLFKSIGVALLAFGLILLLGLAGGSKDVMSPLKVFQGGGTAAAETHLTFKKVKSVEDLNAELAANPKVMLDFYADWCISCKEMDKFTFSDPAVQAALAGVTLLQADVTANDATDKALMKAFQVVGPPAIMFFNNGVETSAARVVGFKKPELFMQNIQQGLNP